MQRRHALMVLLVVLAFAVAVVGAWFLSPQDVTVALDYAPSLIGQTVAVSIDGATVGAFVVPATNHCGGAIDCHAEIGNTSVLKGLHEVRAMLNGTPVLERWVFINTRAYALLIVWNGYYDLDLLDGPPLWL